MGKIQQLFLFLILLVTSCTGGTEKKQSDGNLKKGSELFVKYGCTVCHSLEGKQIYGPPLNDIYKKEFTVVRNGEQLKIKADRKYIKRAISDPGYEKVSGYTSKDMPRTFFSEKDVDVLVDYIIAVNEKGKNSD